MNALSDEERAELASLVLAALKDDLDIAASALAHGNVGLASAALDRLSSHAEAAYETIVKKIYVMEMLRVILDPDSVDRVVAELDERMAGEDQKRRLIRTAELVVKGGGDPGEVGQFVEQTLARGRAG